MTRPSDQSGQSPKRPLTPRRREPRAEVDLTPEQLEAARAYLAQEASNSQDTKPGLLGRILGRGKKHEDRGDDGQDEPEQSADEDSQERGNDKESSRGVVGSLKRFFGSSKGKSDLSESLKRAQKYGGKRRYAMVFVGALVGSLALSLAAVVVASQSVKQADVASEVSKQLEEQGAGFPSGQAVQWAGQVVRVMGTYDENAKDDYVNQVSQFLNGDMDEMAGWNGKGSQQVAFVSVNPQPRVIDGSHAIVTASYQTSTGTWACVDVPVFAFKPSTYGKETTWAFTLSGLPTPTACAARTGLPKLPEVKSGAKSDDDVANTLASDFFPAFFAAWASSDDATLRQYVVDGFTTVGLGGAMQSSPPPTIGDVSMMIDGDGKGDTAKATVEVTWTVSGSLTTRTTTYEMGMRHVGSKWLVASEPVPAYQSSAGSPADIPKPEASEAPATYSNQQPTPPTAAPDATVGASNAAPQATPEATPTEQETSQPQTSAPPAG